MTEGLREKLARREPCLGLYLSLFDPASVELAAIAGYDFIRIDAEHTLFSLAELRELIRTANNCGIPVFARIAGLDNVSAILDAGADGIMVPHVNCKEDARRAIEAVKFAPTGLRGMAGSQRFTRYGGIKLNDCATQSNENTLLCIQIEDREGVENIDDILSLDGIDLVSTGKNDLSQSYGYPGMNNHPQVLAAEETIITKTLEHGKHPILLVSSPDRVKELMGKGCFGFMVGRDTTLLLQGMRESLSIYRDL